MATNADWASIQEAADADGISVSDYVVRRCLDGRESTRSSDVAVPPSVLRRMVRAVLILEEVEQRRVKNGDGEESWHTLAAKVDAWIDREDGLG